MSAIAGPGPSTMASAEAATSSPTVPPSVRQLRMKKRVINLVNPADPGEFSHSSMPSFASPDVSLEMDEELSRRSREVTPTVNIADGPVPVFTIRGVDENGVKGILRQTGTPGSGNGVHRGQGGVPRLTPVRFFPKNRFRVITPNHSLATPQPRTPSLFSQLLSVVPPLSPLRGVVVSAPADESWEQPGQEGEVSMIASSVHSEDRTMESIPPDEDEILPQEDSWSGVPIQMSSPLALPASSSRDVSFQELPSAEMHVPEDMSNLLSTRFSPPPGDSFSILQLPAVPSHSKLRTIASPERSWRDQNSTRSAGLGLQDDCPTVRKRLSPVTSPSGQLRMPVTPHSPTPSADGRPFRSIFADMSAEQADLSWPLVRSHAPTVTLEGQDESAFHSIALADASELPDLPLSRAPAPAPVPARTTATPTAATPRSAGNVTEYFDASSFAFATPCPKPLSTIALPARSTGASNLVEPAKALFEAQAEHTSAILAELALYRNLAQKLQDEVNERDEALVDLNLRAVEAEMLRTQNMDLQSELSTLRDVAATSPGRSSSESDDSPLSVKASSRRHHPGDRTTVQEAENRDLEIRLAKSLADQEVLTKQLSEIRMARDDVVRQLTDSRRVQKGMEERERDWVVAAQKHEEDLRELRATAERAGQDNEVVTGLRDQLREMEDMVQRDGEELRGLRKVVKSYTAKDQAATVRVTELEHALDEERVAREQAEDDLKEARLEITELQSTNRDLEKKQKKSEDMSRNEVAALHQELARLRSESASKDLEISSLQRRKLELKEDREMLNIALDSKQQELELLKRKYGVRGVAGSTPLGTSRKVNLETPAPGLPSSLAKDGATATAPRTTRRTSAALAHFETPLVNDRRTMRHGVPLHASTVKGKGMRALAEELRAEDPKGSVRRTRMIA